MENFQQEFTGQQKAAIISSMIIIAKTNAGIAEVEGRYIEENANILGTDLNDPALIGISQGGRAGLATILNTLSQSNKEWFAYTVYGLLRQNGQPDDRKIQIALAILGDIGITEDELGDIVEKFRALYEKFGRR